MKIIFVLVLLAFNANAVCYLDIIKEGTAKKASGFGYTLKDTGVFSDRYTLYAGDKELSSASPSKRFSSGRKTTEEIRFLSKYYILVTYIYYSITGGWNIDVNPESRGYALFKIKNKKKLELVSEEFGSIVTASPNGKFIAYNKYDSEKTDKKKTTTNSLVIIQSETDKKNTVKNISLEISGLEHISNDGKNVVYVTEDDENDELQYIKVYNVETNKVVLEKQVIEPLTLSNYTDKVGKSKTPNFKYYIVRFTPDGKSLLVGGYLGHKLKKVDIATGVVSEYKE